MRGYNYYGQRSRYEVKAINGVAVDIGNRTLRITAEHNEYKPKIEDEFKVIALRTCVACGEPVAIYAEGSLESLRTKTGERLFGSPWDSGQWWTLLEAGGGFALIATRGHRVHRSYPHEFLQAGCSETEMNAEFGFDPPGEESAVERRKFGNLLAKIREFQTAEVE